MGLRPIFECDQPGCEARAEAQFTPERGFNAPGWRQYGGRLFCSPACVAQYAATEHQAEMDQLRAALQNGAEEGVPSPI